MNKQTIMWTALPNGIGQNTSGTVLKLSVYVSFRCESTLQTEDESLMLKMSEYSDLLDWTARVKDKLRLTVEFEGGPSKAFNDPAVWNGPVKTEYWPVLFSGTTPVRPFMYDGFPNAVIISYPMKSIEEFVQEKYAEIAATYPGDFPPTDVVKSKFEAFSIIEYTKTQVSPGKEIGGVKTFDQKSVLATQQAFSALPGTAKVTMQTQAQQLLKGPGMSFKNSTVSAFQAIAQDLKASRAITSAGKNITKDVVAFSLFHSPFAKEQQGAGQKVMKQTTPVVQKMEFHEAVSALGDYPQFLRTVGLVIDLEIPLDSAIPSSSFVSVKPTWTVGFNAVSTIQISPKTAYQLTSTAFRARTKSGASEIKNGILDMSSESNYDIVQADVDGTALKLKALMASIEQGEQVPAPAAPLLLADAGQFSAVKYNDAVMVSLEAKMSLPALRTQGLSLVQVDRAKKFVAAVDQSSVLNNKVVYVEKNPAVLNQAVLPKEARIELYAEDLVRGYRVDAWSEKTGKWYSLCQRKSTVTFTAGGLTPHTETREGMVGMAMTAAPDQPENQFRMGEAICRWDGWSLIARRPGKRVNDDDNPEDNDNLPKTYTSMSAITEAVPESLPRLRFGRQYRLRARVADLAGNGLELTEIPAGDVTGATRVVRFLRLEPAQAPAVVTRTPYKPGESVERIVIRSNFDKTVVDYRQAHTLSDPDPERHVLAPRTSQQMAEYHGKFDGMTAQSAYSLITSREGFLKEDKQPYPEQSILTIPYLPDPLARGASFSFTWNDKPIGSLELFDFYGSKQWPDARSVRIQVLETAGDVAEAENAQASVKRTSDDLITVFVPKSGVVKVRYSSFVGEEESKLLGIAEWVENKYSGKAVEVEKSSKQGLHWMVTPSREIVIVHALQQPLKPPKFEKLVSEKWYGATYALLHGKALLHGPSTERFELRAQWSEPLDDPLLPEWKMVTGQSHAGDLSVAEKDVDVKFGNQNAEVQSSNVPTGKEPVQVKPGDVKVIQNNTGVVSGAGQPVTAQDAAKQGVVSQGVAKQDPTKQVVTPIYGDKGAVQAGSLVFAHPAVRHEFGDTKYRKVIYTGVATSRFREYYLDLIQPTQYGSPVGGDVSFTREVTHEAIDVLNSARPPAPVVKYIVPTFQWEYQDMGKSILRRRCNGGLRVFLDRPWYLSGEGELLGVVINPGGKMLDEDNAEDNRRRGYVTQWGLDPIVKSSAPIKSAPKLGDFKNAVETRTNVTLEELPPPNVMSMVAPPPVMLHVAGFEPHFDKDRNLWFADVIVDPGQAYFPFVRLALVRFQPNSIVNAHLSRVVLADFVQVVPDRSAAVTFESDKKLVVQVAGVFAQRSSGTLTSPAELNRSMIMTATLEKRTGPGDLSWIPVAPASPMAPPDEPPTSDRMIPTELHGVKMRWVKEIVPPEPVTKGGLQYRVVVREFEIHKDADGKEVLRLVYADSLEL